jgi:hypothetical protein
VFQFADDHCDDQVKYVKLFSDHRWTGRLFKFFNLAKPDKRSPLGWRPTPVLLDLMNKQLTRKSRPNRKLLPVVNKLILDLLIDAVIGDESYKVDRSVLHLGLDTLQ